MIDFDKFGLNDIPETNEIEQEDDGILEQTFDDVVEEVQSFKEEKPVVVADFKCEVCGSDMVVRSGRYGSFYACVNYPKCKNTKQITKDTGVACPDCRAKIVTKHGKNRTVFYSCERYPECSFSSWDAPTQEKCPDCGGILFVKKGKNMLVCHDKECGYKRENTAQENND